VRPVNPVEVEEAIWRLSQILDAQVDKVNRACAEAADAEVAHKVAYAKALLGVEAPTVGEREARATVDTEDTYRVYKHTAAAERAAVDAGRAYRAQMEGLRSLSASLRASMTYTEGEG
jgi:hypothetical protein